MTTNKSQKRCAWLNDNPLMVEYHDKEWGVPIHDDRVLFEFLILEGAQAGLTWQTVLNKRESYRKAFHGFNPLKIASYGKRDIERLLKNPGIIRNRLKVKAAIINAKNFLEVSKEFSSFHKYIWQFVDDKPINHALKSFKRIPTITKESEAMSIDLRKRGFKFVGSTICYAFMQAVGMVNDHTTDCFRYNTIIRQEKRSYGSSFANEET